MQEVMNKEFHWLKLKAHRPSSSSGIDEVPLLSGAHRPRVLPRSSRFRWSKPVAEEIISPSLPVARAVCISCWPQKDMT